MACRSRLQSVTDSLFVVAVAMMVDEKHLCRWRLAGDYPTALFNAAHPGRSMQSAAIFDACLREELAACEDVEVANAADKLVTYLDGREEAAAASREAQTGVCVLDARDGASNLDDRVQRASVEFAHLFVGPPKPAVAPWETFYCQQGCAVGFGEATHQMRTALRDNGLELAQAGRQYEDHMGIELLLASELCRRAGEGEDWSADAGVFLCCERGADAEDTQNA